MKIHIASKILASNEKKALENRKLLKEYSIFTINLMGSPGAGKTSLLEKTIKSLVGQIKIGVVTGDIAGIDDALRIERLGIPVVQINTSGACHLDANMVFNSLLDLPLNAINLLFIENVGNLVCPVEFDLGEDIKAVILSLTEGDDKPLKYPQIFQKSSILLINKIDLMPYLDVSVNRIKEGVLSLNPAIEVFEISCKTGEGFEEWIKWLQTKIS
ncbi:MAG: hydrogenase nickel incorporation protein HypB [Thermodesulfovibrionales bacterium]|nr:hydrogenase nickel incorporation protein HypB [Thermodesulfovibrionales bacterium]